MLPNTIAVDKAYHEVIAVFESDSPIKISEEYELWILKWPVHGFQLRGRRHVDTEKRKRE